jgi:hypothetical protein
MTLYAIYSEDEMKTVTTDGWLCEAILESGIIHPTRAECLPQGSRFWVKVLPSAVRRATIAAWKELAMRETAA